MQLLMYGTGSLLELVQRQFSTPMDVSLRWLISQPNSYRHCQISRETVDMEKRTDVDEWIERLRIG